MLSCYMQNWTQTVFVGMMKFLMLVDGSHVSMLTKHYQTRVCELLAKMFCLKILLCLLCVFHCLFVLLFWDCKHHVISISARATPTAVP